MCSGGGEVVATCSDDGDAKPISLGGVSGGGAEILGLGKVTVEVEVVAVVQRRRLREASFVVGLDEAAAEELEGVVVVNKKKKVIGWW
ncbi:hypothetical protein Q3G72_022888 [Acer saccharum]|nr:hypothetical protein Q3G72_022888 [Acer saccharum]